MSNNIIVDVNIGTGIFYGQVLKVVPMPKTKSLKVYIKSFVELNSQQVLKVVEHFQNMLNFSEHIDIDIVKIDNAEHIPNHIELFKKTVNISDLNGSSCFFREGTLFFDVKNKADDKAIAKELAKLEWLSCMGCNVKVKCKKEAKPKEKSSEGKGKGRQKASEPGHIYGRKKNYDAVDIKDIDERSGGVLVTGYILSSEIIKLRSGKGCLAILSLTDYTSSIGAKLFLKNDAKMDDLENIRKGDYLAIEGHAQPDKFSGELLINVESINKKDPVIERDNAPKKRIELHLHTKMSALDGLVDIKQLIKRVSELGHEAVAITDHGIVQGFPETAEAARKAGIKVLYGVECYLFDDSNPIVQNSKHYSFEDTFVVFDIETTGLNSNTDEIIEIGAVKLKGGKILENFHSYVYTDHTITPFITNLTGISRQTIIDAPKMDTVLNNFMDFCGDCTLAAHNSKFDMSFVSNAANKYGVGFEPACVDTLALSRAVLPKMRSYKLNMICKKLGINLDNHHTALADSTATAKVLAHLLDVAKMQGLDDVGVLNMELGTKAMGRDNIFHAILFAKNQAGLKSLYEMISESHLNYLFRGKPNIPKSLLTKKRENIIVGSACEAGELYTAILKNKSNKKIEELARYYDFLEVQPLGNNEFMLRDGIVNSKQDLIDINKKIIELGRKFNKLVVATGDVHFLYARDEYFRRILMHGQKFSDADMQAPLYYRTTQEMLNEFNYLDPATAHEIVIDNPHAICDMIDELQPLPPYKLYPPFIEGAEEEVKRLSYETAHKLYGEEIPEIVQKRLDKELNSIIGNGYSVLYLIAHKLVKKSNDDGYLVGSRGSVGSSFVACMMGITEVNSLPSHYTCDKCKYSDFNIDTAKYACGPDMPDAVCPNCGAILIKRGFDIPFEVFLGFEGDKVPDIDLNFSGVYQPVVHKYTETLLGAKNVFRAGTLSSIASRTAFGFVKNYLDEKEVYAPRAEVDRLVDGCSGVKRTTGQHPGGLIVVPDDMDVHDFTPIQHPADDKESGIITTHFDFNSMHDRLVKLDILGHDDPTVLKMLENLTGLLPTDIPLDDEDTMSLFSSPAALGVTPEEIGAESGTFGIPEFGTKFVREMLKETKPKTFAELVRISGLSHGTDVWVGNARDLVLGGTATLLEAICTRDDIMNALITMGVESKMAFTTMESVRKGKGLTEDMEMAMIENEVPEWFINSCKLIKYMFPKAHAVAYVTMGFRVAYYKVNYPMEYYTTYFTVRADDFDAQLMLKPKEEIKRMIQKYEEMQKPMGAKLGVKDKSILTILELVHEMRCRGIDFVPVDIYKSGATDFKITEDGIMPPLNALPGLGDNAARTVVEARKDGEFNTIEDLRKRAKLNKSVIQLLKEQGCLDGIPENNQVSMFEMF